VTSIETGESFGRSGVSIQTMSPLTTDFDHGPLDGPGSTPMMRAVTTVTAICQVAEKRRWVEDLEERILGRYHEFVAPLLNRYPRKAIPVDVTETDIFPTSKQTDPEWGKHSGSVWVNNSWDIFMSTIVLKGQEVPDWLYGFISHQNNTCLPEEGTADEIKEAIYAVMEESAAGVIRRVNQMLDSYSIKILTVEVDLLGEHITLHCTTDKPVMQINTIMGNAKVRNAMPPRARVCVNTHVEQGRRTDDYLKHRPEKQEISREFFYENGTIVRDEPQHWSAGMKHEPGDILRIGSIAMRVEEDRRSWANVAFDGDPVAGRNEHRRVQVGTPFQPGERAYWNAARNR
jgi:hypothetical protein